MKTFQQIKRQAEKGDYQRVADITKKSVSTIKMVVYGERIDYHNIQKVFSDLIENRERIAAREERRRIRIEKRNRIAA